MQKLGTLPIFCIIIIISIHFFGKFHRTLSKNGESPHFLVVVCFSRYLHFLAVHESNFVDVYQGFPLKIPDIKKAIRASLNDENFLWVAVEEGIARKVYHVIPRQTLSERIEVAKEFTVFNVKQGEPYRIKGDVIEGHYRHTPRYILTLKDLPEFNEPVILVFHPSFFEFDEGPEELIKALKARGIRYDSIRFYEPKDYKNNEALEKFSRLKWLIERDL
jgi:hypothetical protein